MPRIRRFNKNSFRGNQHSKKKGNVGPVDITLPGPSPKTSSSSKKINNSKLPKSYEYEPNDVNFIVDLGQISNLIKSFVQCKHCGNCNCIEISLDEDFKCGLVHRVIVRCNVCNNADQTMSSKCLHNVYELNLRYVYALRSIGKGLDSGKTFSAVMNIAPPNSRFEKYNNKLLNAVTEVCECSLQQAADEARNINEGSGDIAAAFDGTWQRRGHTSINGVVTVTSFDSGKVLDYECLCKYCNICIRKPLINNEEALREHKESGNCLANYSGSSGGMEVLGATKLCSRSEEKLQLRFTKYLGDGDSKGFMAVLENNPYGQDVPISKLECVGHIQKRLGTRLRRLKKEKKGVKLNDGMTLGGKGRLTDVEIDQLQRYYGMAIRKNLESVEKMRRAIWATYYHKLSTDEEPHHELCPTGSESWCKYKQAQENNLLDEFKHKNSLPKSVMEIIKPIYKDLSCPSLLKKCLHGKTQNPNESINSVIWSRLSKTTFVGIQTLNLGVADAVLCFNEGSVAKVNVLQRIGIKAGRFTIEGLLDIDRNRIRKADKEVQEENKKKRVRRRLQGKRKNEDSEDYCPGGF